MGLAFTKWQGCGNDFVLADGRASGLPRDVAALSRHVCDRHYGVGADGLIFVLPSDKADFCMRIFNADGSEAEMCGNGIRCFARLVYEERMTEKESFTVETGAGILTPRIVKENGIIIGIEVNMGEPILEAEKIPVAGLGTIAWSRKRSRCWASGIGRPAFRWETLIASFSSTTSTMWQWKRSDPPSSIMRGFRDGRIRSSSRYATGSIYGCASGNAARR